MAVKNLNKETIVAVLGGLLISGGAYLTYQRVAVPQPKMSDLTLANIEAMAISDGEKDTNEHYEVWCQGSGDIICPISNSKVKVYAVMQQ